MNIINTSARIPGVFDSGRFHMENWRSYMDDCVPGAKEVCLDDLQKMSDAGFSWQKDILPVLNIAAKDTVRRKKAIESFCRVTEHLEERVTERFRKTLDVDIILYLGLCNGAGWVTSVNGKLSVLLGIEKIMELDWCDTDAMTGLIVHELGHVYQAQYGVLHRKTESLQDQFLWQLFTEGIAMVFEQEIVGDPEYFHQDVNGWKKWCDGNAQLLLRSFCSDLKSMTPESQRYFGDWVSFEGYGDTGYYLGARFIRFLLAHDSFDHLILWEIPEVSDGFDRFLHSALCSGLL